MFHMNNENKSLKIDLRCDLNAKPRSMEWSIQPTWGPTLTCWLWRFPIPSPTFNALFQSRIDSGGRNTPSELCCGANWIFPRVPLPLLCIDRTCSQLLSLPRDNSFPNAFSKVLFSWYFTRKLVREFLIWLSYVVE